MSTVATDIAALTRTDARCRALAQGLLQLSTAELHRLARTLTENPASVVVDSCNYNLRSGAWCPLAVGLGVPEIAAARGGVISNADGRRLILEVGRAKHGRFSLNPVSGIAGDFYRDDRHADLMVLVQYLLPPH